jgi:hypothetical protein
LTGLSADDNYQIDQEDRSLETLLDLDGEVTDLGHGYTVFYTVTRIAPTPERPHGLNYSLCLIGPNDDRLVCFDNAHGIDVGNGPSRHKSEVYDHAHRGTNVRPYHYTDAGTLISDFWHVVGLVMKAEGMS